MGDILDRLEESIKACRALDRSELLKEAIEEIRMLRRDIVYLRAVTEAMTKTKGAEVQ